MGEIRMAAVVSLTLLTLPVTLLVTSFRGAATHAADCARFDGVARIHCEEHRTERRSPEQRKKKAAPGPRRGDKPGTVAPSRTPGKPIIDDRAHYFAGTEPDAR